MKKIILSTFAVGLLAAGAHAQGIGPELGINFSNMAFKELGNTASTDMKIGLRVGATADIGITDNLYFQPSLFFVMNGAKQSESVGGVDYKYTYSVNTIELPLRIIYKLGDPGSNRFFFGIYPYLAYNIGGNFKTEAGSQSESTSLEIGTEAGKDNIKPLDLGAGVTLGYQLESGLFFRAHYQMGFANLAPGGDSDNSIKSSNFGVSVGWLFNE